MLEIGPGPGGLTRALRPYTQRLIAIEVDNQMAEGLQREFSPDPKVEIIHGDVLSADLSQWGPLVVAGNLPYYITSPILERVLALGPLLQRAVFLVQKEVAERLAARPGTRDYGYLSVTTQCAARVEVLFAVKPGSFRPPPKVDSAVVRLTPHAEPTVSHQAPFLRFAGFCFAQKRKTLRNNLAPHYGREWIDAQPEAGLRAEQLSLAQLQDLFNRVPGR